MQINIITDGQLLQMEQREFDEAYDRGFGFPGTWCHRCQAWHPWTGYWRAADGRTDEPRPGHCLALEFAEYERPIGGGYGPETCTVITCRDGREVLFPFTRIRALRQVGITPESSDSEIRQAVEESEDPECEPVEWCEECGRPHGVSHVCHGCDYEGRVDGLLAEGYSAVDARVEAGLGGGL